MSQGTTKAVRVHAVGGPEQMVVDEVPTPVPAAGEVLIAVEAAGVNFIDVYDRTGVYTHPLPLTLGREGAGTVVQLGDGVDQLSVGDRVAWAMVTGSYATHIVAPWDRVAPVPAATSSVDAAAAMLQGMTAHYLTRSTFPLKVGDTCLVHAAAGGVGLLLCQMASAVGARVIGTVSSDAKAELARAAGAHDLIRYDQHDFVAEVKRLVGSVDVVYDGVGKDTFERGFDCLRPRGYMVLFGASSGRPAPIDPDLLSRKGSLFVTRPTLTHHAEQREELLWRASEVFEMMNTGSLSLRVDSSMSIEQAAEAHRKLEGRATTGKLVLVT